MRKSRLLIFMCLVLAATMIGNTSARATDSVKIRWYVGLGTGSETQKLQAQQDVVKAFNASQKEIQVELEVVANNDAFTTLNTEIAAGNAPDVVGPVGIRGRDQFPGAWLDLTQVMAESKYDLSDFDPALVTFYKDPKYGQLGLPFGIYPSFLFVNTDLFDDAGIAYPPVKYGDPYIDKKGNKKEWNLDTLREIAMQLTFDKNGKNATDKAFNADQIVQFGFDQQYTDFRGRCTIFGAANPISADGKAIFPDNWKDCSAWLQKSIWTDHFYPSSAYEGSDILNKGNPFPSGNLAMDQVHTWYIGGLNDVKFKWNIFAMPSYKGKATAKLHADTFGIMKATKHPKEAFAFMSYLIGPAASPLTVLYGAMTARNSLQKDYFAQLGKSDAIKGLKDFNFGVISDSAKYNDNPNHESGLPNPLEASDRVSKFGNDLATDPKFDLSAESAKLVTDLQKLYDVKK